MSHERLLSTALAVCILLAGTAAHGGELCYTLASLNGNWGLVTSYGNEGGHVAIALSVRRFDGQGNLQGTFILNEPVVGSASGARKVVPGTVVGTYTVNCDGSGVISRYVTTPAGTVTQTEDFVVTQAELKDGQLVATAITDASREPSKIVPGGVFVTRTYTRRPDTTAD